MASLTVKTINGRKYYYARVCKRVDGKPKVVQTIYLGSLDKIIRNAQHAAQPRTPDEVHVTEFGATAALLDVANQWGFVETVDRHAPKRRQGPTVGQFMLIAALNRAIRPASKVQLADWFAQTAGPRLLGVQPARLSSQAFWNHMKRLTPQRLARIEEDLCRRLVETFHIGLDCLLYDATNFYTYINTRTAGDLAQRGHNKQKRHDLRQVSLGMIASTDFHVPLLHMVYGGNVQDATQFGTVIETLVQRYRALAEACPHITLVFDKGNNAEANLRALGQTDLHFVGSLKLNQCRDLLEVPLDAYRPLTGDGLETVRAYRQQREVFGVERTVLVTHNENLLAGQLQGIGRNLGKTKAELHDLQKRLRRWATGQIRRGKRPTLAGVQKKVQKLLHREYMKDIIAVTLQEQDGFVVLHYRVDPDAIAHLTRTGLGKTILFTDNDAWADEAIVRAYRSQYHIEHAFREMKHPRFLSWRPRYHWTDDQIRVHAFYCVTALTLVGLVRRTLAAQDLALSTEAVLSHLTGIRETLLVHAMPRHRTQLCQALTHMTPTQRDLYTALGLDRFRSV